MDVGIVGHLVGVIHPLGEPHAEQRVCQEHLHVDIPEDDPGLSGPPRDVEVHLTPAPAEQERQREQGQRQGPPAEPQPGIDAQADHQGQRPAARVGQDQGLEQQGQG